MNRRNYAQELNKIIEKQGNRKPTVLLHSCCGPCSSSVLEFLTRYFTVTVFWYNPNLYPEEEFSRRYDTQLEIIEKMGLSQEVSVIYLPWRHEEYLSAVRGFETEPEGGKRCAECFRVHLSKCAIIAKEKKFDYFCSTLTVSRHKNALLINSIGEDVAKVSEILWLPSDFKKNNGENRSVELSEKYGIYRQVYCGCEFSLSSRVNNINIIRKELGENGSKAQSK